MSQANHKIECPNCLHEINVGRILYSQFEKDSKRRYEEELNKHNKIFQDRLNALEIKEKNIKKDKENLDNIVQQQIHKRLQENKAELEKSLKKDIENKQSEYLNNLQEQLRQQSEELKSFQKAKAQILKLEREKDELKDRVELAAEEKFTKQLKEQTEKIKRLEQERMELKLSEKEKTINDLNKQLKDAQLKIEQGSVQLQGEVQELAIEAWLKNNFPLDNVEEVLKGQNGADCLQRINTRGKLNCGTIYYESKRTKSFNNDWIRKFKEDIRNNNADIGVIVTQVMPKGMERMGIKNGIWICTFDEFKGLCFVLREFLVKLSDAIVTQQNRGAKMERLYDYLTGNEFKLQVESIVEGFTQMQNDLAKEKRYVTKIWKDRERQIQKVLESTTDMYVSVKHIAGRAIPDVSLLEIPSDDYPTELQVSEVSS